MSATRFLSAKFSVTNHAVIMKRLAIASSGPLMTSSVLAGMTRSFNGPAVDPKDIQPVIDVAVRYGYLEKPLDVQQLISPIAVRAH